MNVTFRKHWHEFKPGEVIDLPPVQAMFLYQCGLVKWVDRPDKVTLDALMAKPWGAASVGLGAETAMAEPAPETTDARPKFRKRKRAKK